jgi:hypothetical protein
MSLNLHDTLRRNEVETLMRNARLTRGWPDEQERREEAERQVRRAMYRAGLDQLTDQERARILEILRPCCPEVFEIAPPPTETDWELTYMASSRPSGSANS